ncbi:PqqD family protein [Spirosoma montaniterrae]|uniref:Thymidylate synthase n=1 Tax=Spirosoma montaniterrae TaxID=1178516 RepID=A0A1P9WSA8_9BACT|nr:PqqD family protein [Spirosoma montaniterrae]AQG78240.1 thymidylate synthase [Spirosoma montaniterrae]
MQTAFAPDTRVRARTGQASSLLGQETILLNYEAGTYYELNETGSFIWSLLQNQQPVSVGELETRMLAEFDVEPAICGNELTTFLDDLLREEIIELV